MSRTSVLLACDGEDPVVLRTLDFVHEVCPVGGCSGLHIRVIHTINMAAESLTKSTVQYAQI